MNAIRDIAELAAVIIEVLQLIQGNNADSAAPVRSVINHSIANEYEHSQGVAVLLSTWCHPQRHPIGAFEEASNCRLNGSDGPPEQHSHENERIDSCQEIEQYQ